MASIFEFKEIDFFMDLQPFFAEAGYYFLPDRQQYRRQAGSAYQNVVIRPVRYYDRIYFEVRFGSSFPLIEETLRMYCKPLVGLQHSQHTVVTTLGRYLEEPSFRLMAQGQQQLDEITDYLRSFFHLSGFDFLEQLAELDRVERAYNLNPQKDSPLSLDQDLHPFRGIIMAHLCGAPHWEQLKEQYLNSLIRRQAPKKYLQNFADLADYLVNFGPN